MILLLVSSCITLISGHTLTYVMLDDGSPFCSSKGLKSIKDEGTCKIAANMLKGKKGWKPVNMYYVPPDGVNIPNGCFRQDGRLYWNNFKNVASPGSCSSLTPCLCIGEPHSAIGHETHLPAKPIYFLTEEDCRDAAIRFGLSLGGAGHEFVSVGDGTALTKGCYGYYLGRFQGMAFWVSGHSRYATTRTELPHCPKFRLIEMGGKMVPPGPDEGTCKLDDCPAQCLDVRGHECHKCISKHNYCGRQDHFCDGGIQCWGCAMNAFPTPKPTTAHPSTSPTSVPTTQPTPSPTYEPTTTESPTTPPSTLPTFSPTIIPTFSPTKPPTNKPTMPPTPQPTTTKPTPSPSTLPTMTPTRSPTIVPTFTPSVSPTPRPSNTETRTSLTPSPTSPTSKPTELPTLFRGFLRDGCMDVKFRSLCTAFPECSWTKNHCISNNAGCVDTLSTKQCMKISRQNKCWNNRDVCKMTCGCCNRNPPNKCVDVAMSPELCVFGGYWKNCALSCEMCVIRQKFPTPSPTQAITLKPSSFPSRKPTMSPSIVPSPAPSQIQTRKPTDDSSLNDIRDGCMDVKIKDLCVLLDECSWTNKLCIASNKGCRDKLGFKECKKVINRGQCLEKRDECKLSCGCCNLNTPKKCIAVVENPDLCFLGGYWKNCALSCGMCVFNKDR